MKDNTSSLTPAELRVYNFVCENDPVSAKDAAAALGIEVGSFYPLYRRIRMKGLIIPPLRRNGPNYVTLEQRRPGIQPRASDPLDVDDTTGKNPSTLLREISQKFDRTNVLLGKLTDVLEQTLSKLVQRDV